MYQSEFIRTMRVVNVKSVICSGFLALGLYSSFACINTSETETFNSTFHRRTKEDYTVAHLHERRDRAYWEKRERELRRLIRPHAGAIVRSDYAGILIHLGRYVEAREMLEEVERKEPGRWYGVAANMGTACELMGDNAAALKWIREGLRRNPKGHSGTEWLHIRILEAKLAIEKDPDWLRKNRVSGADFGTGELAIGPWGIPKHLDSEAFAKALFYQLHERLEFVPAPDPIVADLLSDLADILSLRGESKQGLPFYDLALEYGPPHPEKVRRRRDAVQQRKLIGIR